MKRGLVLWLLLWAPLASAVAQTGVLFGRVLDAQSGAPLGNAEINLAQKRATTDSSGAYRLADVPAGVHALTVRRLGYESLQQNVSVITGAESETDFRLTRVSSLDTVRTTAAATPIPNASVSPAMRQFEERRKTGNGKFITEETLRENDNRTLGNLLKRLSGIRVYVYNGGEYVQSSRAAGVGKAGSLLGGVQAQPPRADPARIDSPRGCWVSVYMDGLSIYNGGSSEVAPDVSKILVRDVAGVEFYSGSGTLPAQFSAIKGSECGVLLLWSRLR